MSILKTAEDSVDGKRCDTVKHATVSFGDVYIQGTDEDSSPDQGEEAALVASENSEKVIHKRGYYNRLSEEDLPETYFFPLSRDTDPVSVFDPPLYDPGGGGARMDGDEREQTTKVDKVTFCDNKEDIPSSPGREGQASPTTVSEIIVLDRLPPGHWPLKRSTSLESRDNPFMPGSELCKEADDIIKRATIVRDTFYLKDNSDGSVICNDDDHGSSPVVEETLLSQTVESTNTAPDVKSPRQNGKIDESSTVSPVCNKPELNNDQADGVSKDDSLKDKKKQKKCCSVM